MLAVISIFFIGCSRFSTKPKKASSSKKYLEVATQIDTLNGSDVNLFDNASIANFLEIEKNNAIHDFLKESDDGIYFLDLLIDTIALRNSGKRYVHTSSITTSEIDKRYVSGFVDRITPFLLQAQVDTLRFTLMLPVDENAVPQPPPPPADFFGNIEGGTLPEVIDNPYH